MGYVSVGNVLSGRFADAKAMDQIYRYLLKQGTSLGQEDKMMPFNTFTEIVGLEKKNALDEKYRPEK